MDLSSQSVSPTELDILKVLWEHGPGTVRDINRELHARGRKWAYTTVQTLLRRLEGKGHVAVDTGGFAHVFRAARTREDLVEQGLRALADQLCEGASTPLLLSLVQGHSFTADEIARFRDLLDTLEKESTSTQPKSPKPRKRRR